MAKLTGGHISLVEQIDEERHRKIYGGDYNTMTVTPYEEQENVSVRFARLEKAAIREERVSHIWRVLGIGLGLLALTAVQIVLVLLGMKLGMSFEWSALIIILLNINIVSLAAVSWMPKDTPEVDIRVAL